MGGTFAVLFIFIGMRGRVPIEPGWGGMTIARFTGFERACHWVLALSFLGLAATGFAQLYAAPLRTLVGADALAAWQAIGRAAAQRPGVRIHARARRGVPDLAAAQPARAGATPSGSARPAAC